MDFSGFDQPAFSTQAPTATGAGSGAGTPAKSPGFLSKVVSNFVHAPKEVGKALTSAPAAINREIHNKPITDIQNNVFGTADSGQIFKKTVGDLAQVGALALPGIGEAGGAAAGADAVGEAGAQAERTIGQKVLTGVRGGGLFSGGASLANNDNAGKVAKNTLIGGAIGGATEYGGSILGKILGKGGQVGADAVENGRNILQKTGDSLDRSVISPKVNPSPFSAGKAQDLVDYLKDSKVFTPGDNAQKVLEKLGPHYNELQSQIEGQLEAKPSIVNVNDLSQQIKDAVAKNNRFGGTDIASQQALDNTDGILRELATKNGSADVSATDIYKLKNEVQDELGKAFDKVGKGGALNGNEDALMAIRNTFNDALPEEVRQLGKNQSILYDAAPGLARNATDKLRVPLFGVFGPRIPSQAGSNLFQSLKSGAGGLAGKTGDAIASGTKAIPSAVEKTISSAATPLAVAGANAAQSSPAGPSAGIAPGDSAPTNPTSPHFNAQTGKIELPQNTSPTNTLGVSSDDISKAMMEDLAQNGGKNLSKLNTIYGIAKAQEKANNPTAAITNKTTAANEALSGLSDLTKSFDATNLTGHGILSKVISDSPLGGTSLKAINDQLPQIAASVAKARGSGTAKDVLSELPSPTDSKTVALQKITNLKNSIQQYIQESQDPSQGTDDQSAQLMQALSSLGQ